MDALPIHEQADVPFRSEIDGHMHACGHDCHTAMLLGAARMLKARESELPGVVKLIFQPAEEGGAGADRMCNEGVLQSPDVQQIFGLHVWPGANTGTVVGNAGIILSEFLRGVGAALAAVPQPAGIALADALDHACDAAYAAVDRPVEGTMLSVLRAAAESARETGSDDLSTVVSAAVAAAESALARTPQQLPVLAAAGVVDAGGRGLCVVLDALNDVVAGRQRQPATIDVPIPSAPAHSVTLGGPAFEVMYLLETSGDGPEEAIALLRQRLTASNKSSASPKRRRAGPRT